MIIDLILNIKENNNYNAKKFYNDVMGYYGVFPEIVEPIANALDGGSNADIKKELMLYIIGQEYNTEICNFINGHKWI